MPHRSFSSHPDPHFPHDPFVASSIYRRRPAIAGPIVFTAGLVSLSFVAAGSLFDKRQADIWRRVVQLTGTTRPSVQEAVSAMRSQAQRRIDAQYKKVNEWHLPRDIQRAYLMVVQKIAMLSEAQKTIYSIIGVNAAVFLAWRIPSPAVYSFMTKYFVHHPLSGRSVTLLTSCFSHKDLWHLGLNMLALYSFGGLIHEALGREQFLAFYLSTGGVANLVSHLMALRLSSRRPVLPSLGASGAIYGCLSATAWVVPNASVYIVFLPFIPIKLGYALPALMGLDLTGILAGWRMFDHYAHLTGATLGLWYFVQGRQLIWNPIEQRAMQAQSERMAALSSRERWTWPWNK